MSDQNQQKSTERRLVPVEYYEAFALRMLGLSYAQIAQKTGYQPQTVRKLFMNGGVLNQLWRQWAEGTKKKNVEEIMDMFYAHLPDIIRRRILFAKSSDDPAAVVITKIMLDYTLGDPKNRPPSEHSEPQTIAEWIKQETLKDQAAEEVAKDGDI